MHYFNFVLPFSEGEGSGGSEESESEEEVVEEGVTVKRKKKHRRKSKLKQAFHLKNTCLGFLKMPAVSDLKISDLIWSLSKTQAIWITTSNTGLR